jgi:hypothetical protein
MNQVTTEFLENGSGLMQQRSTKGKIPQDLGGKKTLYVNNNNQGPDNCVRNII